MKKVLVALLLLGGLARAQEPQDATFKIKIHPTHFKGYKKSKAIKAIKKVDFWTQQPRLTFPDRLDLRAIGKGLSQIEDQGRAGNCWAFALIAALRDTLLLMGHDPGRISQQYLVDSARAIGMGCNGGDFDAEKYLEWPKGAPSWASYPYSDSRCNGPLKKSKPLAGAANFVFIKPSHYNIMYVLSKLKRPLVTVVAAGTGAWEYYDGGTYNACRLGQVDHMIDIVGMDREGAQFDANGNLPPGKGVGILRNHWTVGWGEAGWMNSKLTDPRGRPCNELNVEIGYWEVGNAPLP